MPGVMPPIGSRAGSGAGSMTPPPVRHHRGSSGSVRSCHVLPKPIRPVRSRRGATGVVKARGAPAPADDALQGLQPRHGPRPS